ncbi:MAG: hypothetical protein HN834_17610 [Rhodospirillaceae bacterium]|jgi:hypothetical protein|nr:hypothetical protein [Rhodospirillaceae bacterium]MBT7976059.1 hypothetical protein [Rhodospirillaceae bacterium]
MANNKGSNLSTAFDALLDKNWRSLDELSGRAPQPRASTRPVAPARAAPAAGSARTEGGKSGRKSGRSNGIDFTFDI